MRLVQLKMQNFLSVGEEQEVQLDNQGLVLIEGENRDDPTVESNGAGKSTLIEALLWCLYGETLRGLRGDDVVNRAVGENTHVMVSFDHPDGTRYVVHRYRKHVRDKNALYLHALSPFRDLSKSEAVETQKAITEAVGMDFSVFTTTVIYGQGAFTRFAALGDARQKEILEKVLGVEAFREAHAMAKNRVKRYEELLDTLERSLPDVASLTDEWRKHKKAAGKWEDERAQEVERLTKRIEGERATKVRAGTKEAAMEQLAEAKVRMNNARDTYEDMRRKVSAARARVEALKEQLEDTKKVEGGECPTCGAVDASGTRMDKHRADLKSKLMKEEMALDERKATADWGQTEAKRAEREVALIEEKLDKLRLQERASVEAVARIGALTEQLSRKHAEVNPYKKLVIEAQTKLRKAKAKAKTVRKKRKAIKVELSRSRFWAAAFSDKGAKGLPPLKGLLLDAELPVLNKKLAHYARYLSGGALRVSVESQSTLKNGEVRDRMAVVAENATGGDEYAALSGGEKRKADVAVSLALQGLMSDKRRASCNVIFFDEPFDSLDDNAQEHVVNLLVNEAKKTESVFVITHSNALKAHFQRVITVVKENGISRVSQ